MTDLTAVDAQIDSLYQAYDAAIDKYETAATDEEAARFLRDVKAAEAQILSLTKQRTKIENATFQAPGFVTNNPMVDDPSTLQDESERSSLLGATKGFVGDMVDPIWNPRETAQNLGDLLMGTGQLMRFGPSGGETDRMAQQPGYDPEQDRRYLPEYIGREYRDDWGFGPDGAGGIREKFEEDPFKHAIDAGSVGLGLPGLAGRALMTLNPATAAAKLAKAVPSGIARMTPDTYQPGANYYARSLEPGTKMDVDELIEVLEPGLRGEYKLRPNHWRRLKAEIATRGRAIAEQLENLKPTGVPNTGVFRDRQGKVIRNELAVSRDYIVNQFAAALAEKLQAFALDRASYITTANELLDKLLKGNADKPWLTLPMLHEAKILAADVVNYDKKKPEGSWPSDVGQELFADVLRNTIEEFGPRRTLPDGTTKSIIEEQNADLGKLFEFKKIYGPAVTKQFYTPAPWTQGAMGVGAMSGGAYFLSKGFEDLGISPEAVGFGGALLGLGIQLTMRNPQVAPTIAFMLNRLKNEKARDAFLAKNRWINASELALLQAHDVNEVARMFEVLQGDDLYTKATDSPVADLMNI